MIAMKLSIATIVVALLGPSQAQAQERRQDGVSRQDDRESERFRDRYDRRSSSDAERLDRLLRMRERSDRRARQLRQPVQESRPANSQDPGNNAVRTQ